MNEVFVMYEFYSGDELICQQEDGFQRESSRAKVEEILETRAEKLHHHHIEVTLKEDHCQIDLSYVISRLGILAF